MIKIDIVIGLRSNVLLNPFTIDSIRNHKGGLLPSLKLDPETSSSEPTTVKENVF